MAAPSTSPKQLSPTTRDQKRQDGEIRRMLATESGKAQRTKPITLPSMPFDWREDADNRG